MTGRIANGIFDGAGAANEAVEDDGAEMDARVEVDVIEKDARVEEDVGGGRENEDLEEGAMAMDPLPVAKDPREEGSEEKEPFLPPVKAGTASVSPESKSEPDAIPTQPTFFGASSSSSTMSFPAASLVPGESKSMRPAMRRGRAAHLAARRVRYRHTRRAKMTMSAAIPTTTPLIKPFDIGFPTAGFPDAVYTRRELMDQYASAKALGVL